MLIIQNLILLDQIDEIFFHFDLEVTSAETKELIGPIYIYSKVKVLWDQGLYR